MTKFTFYPNSVKGLDIYVSVTAHTFKDAKNLVLKWLYLGVQHKHEGQYPHHIDEHAES